MDDDCHSMTSLAGSLYGNGRNRTVFTTLKIAVFAPMPMANVSNAMAVKPGLLNSMRNA